MWWNMSIITNSHSLELKYTFPAYYIKPYLKSPLRHRCPTVPVIVDAIVILRWIILFEYQRWTSTFLLLQPTRLWTANLLPTRANLNHQEGFTVCLRQKPAALSCDAGWLSAQEHPLYFHRCRRGTRCSRTGGESTRWQGDKGKKKEAEGGEHERDHGRRIASTWLCSRTIITLARGEDFLTVL